MARKTDYPFEDCKLCSGLECCPEPDVLEDGLGSPVPPDCCPRPIDILKTLKKRRDELSTPV